MDMSEIAQEAPVSLFSNIGQCDHAEMSDVLEHQRVRFDESRGQDGKGETVPTGVCLLVEHADVRCDDRLGQERVLGLVAKLAAGAE